MIYNGELTVFGMNKDGAMFMQRDHEMMLYRIEDDDWYATQQGRGVAIFKQGSEKPMRILEPPHEWGEDWSWNRGEGGIYFSHTSVELG